MFAAVIAAAYLIGSIPFALILSRRWGADLRQVGSGNMGAANVMRASGVSAGVLVAAVCKPAVGLQQDRRAEVLVLVPPVARAGGGAAEAKDAFPHPVELGPILGRLPPLAVRRRLVGLQPRLDQCVLRVQSGQVRNEILQDRQMWKRRDSTRTCL